jgi:hypothetical protein
VPARGHDPVMTRALAGVLLALAMWAGVPAQELPVLHIEASVGDAGGRAVPVAQYVLLVSANPPSAPPRLVHTSPDGTADVPLRPGSYTVESDRPFVLAGRSYTWVQMVDIAAGGDTTLRLTAANADVGAATADLLREAAAAASTPEAREDSILSTSQASTFELWTPRVRAAGFLVDARGLVATSRRAIGDATAVEVQVSPSVKVAGTVLVADTSQDAAIVRVDPSAVGGIRPVPLACDAPAAAGADHYLIDVPWFGPRDVTSLLVVSAGAAGGPVFAGDDRAIGLSAPAEDDDGHGDIDVRVVGADRVCQALALARARLDTPPPDATRLPIEPARRLGVADTDAAKAGGAFSLGPYQLSSSDFDISFLTPAVLAGAEARRGWSGVRADELSGLRVATDFEYWSDYVASAPPLLYVRVTPRLVEGFWTKVARVAASTQGADIPPIKRLRPGFSHLRLLCGGKDVTPIHPFRIQARVTETEAIEEGFYVFDPAAIGPSCGTVSLVLSSVKDPEQTETRTVDPAIVRRVWDDFANVRAASDR